MEFKKVKPDKKIRERLANCGWKLAHKNSFYEFYTASGKFDYTFTAEDTVQLCVNRRGDVYSAIRWVDGRMENGHIFAGVPT